MKSDENLDALVEHSGPPFEHWRRRLAASVGATLLDAGQPDPHTASDA